MKNYLFILTSALLIVLSAGCSSEDQDSNLYNSWILVSYGSESNEVLKEAKGYFYQITFNPDGTYSGIAYGNEMGGQYKRTGNTIIIFDGDITTVEVIGSDPDRFFLKHLHDVSTYKISASELKLYYSKDEFFKFRIKNSNI